MNRLTTILTAALPMLLTSALSAGSLRFEGYAGNSGDRKRPVQFGPRQSGNNHSNQTQTPPVYDPAAGRIYMTAGDGVLNAYTLDGRMAASYRIPKGYFDPDGDPMVRCGNKLFFRRNTRIWELPLNAPDGAAAVRANYPMTATQAATNGVVLLSSSSRDGKIAVLRRNGDLHLFDPAAGTSRPLGNLDAKNINVIDWNADGELFAICGKTVCKVENGKILRNQEWPKAVIGRAHPVINGRFIGNHFYGGGMHSTITRLNGKTLESDPGVVLGGRSGYFIGYVFTDPELGIPSGITGIAPGLFAVGGRRGVILLVRWNPETGKLDRCRRIGAADFVPAMELDSLGRMSAGNIIVNWNDEEIAPAAGDAGLPPAVSARNGDDIIQIGLRYGKFALTAGKLDDGKRPTVIENSFTLPASPVGAAVLGSGPVKKLVILSASGQTANATLHYDLHRGSLKPLPTGRLQCAVPVKQFSSMVALNDRTLLAVGDDRVIRFEPDGDHWKETSRWARTVAPGSRIAADRNRVAVAEPANHCVTLYSADGQTELATQPIPSPGALALNGNHLAVHETANQRIAKYLLEE